MGFKWASFDRRRKRQRTTGRCKGQPPQRPNSKTLTAIKNASRPVDDRRHASAWTRAAKAAITDIHAQLDHLLPPDLMAHALPADLAKFQRYLRPITARLDRAIANPKKDAGKLAPLLPVWTHLLQKRKTPVRPSKRC